MIRSALAPAIALFALGATTPVKYDGVTVASLLASVGVPTGDTVKGPPARRT